MKPDRTSMQRAASRQAMGALLVGAGWALLAAAVIWRLWAGAAWNLRVRPGWEWIITYIGTVAQSAPGAGRLEEPDAPALYQRLIRAISPGERRGGVLLEEQWVVWDAASGEKTVKSVYRAEVDGRDGRHLDGPAAGQAFLFPRGVRRAAYTLRTGHLKGLALSFEGRERLDGLETHRFGYEGPAEYSEAYAGGAGAPGIRLSAGQQIKCRDDQFAIRMWVEPMTGEVVKATEGCPTGDYVYDTATDLPIQPVARWSGVSAEDEMAGRIAELRRRCRLDRWMLGGLPALMASAGLAMLLVANRRALFGRLQPGGAR